MKHKILFLISLVALGGCAAVITPEYEYYRLGNQEIDGLEITTSDGTEIKLNKQKTQTESIKDILKIIELMAAP